MAGIERYGQCEHAREACKIRLGHPAAGLGLGNVEMWQTVRMNNVVAGVGTTGKGRGWGAALRVLESSSASEDL